MTEQERVERTNAIGNSKIDPTIRTENAKSKELEILEAKNAPECKETD